MSDDARAWLARSTGIAAAQIQLAPMQGATSSSLFLVRDAGSQRRRFVLRLFDRREWLAEEPDLASHEAAALLEARKTGLSTPELVAACEDATLFGAPAILMSYLAGRVELRPEDLQAWLMALAEPLAQLHRHKADSFPWRYTTWVQASVLHVPSWTSNPHG